MIILSSILILLFIISLSKIYNHNGEGKFTLNPFNVVAIEPLKGLLALMVMFCHIAPNVDFGIFSEFGNYVLLQLVCFFSSLDMVC